MLSGWRTDAGRMLNGWQTGAFAPSATRGIEHQCNGVYLLTFNQAEAIATQTDAKVMLFRGQEGVRAARQARQRRPGR